MLIRDLEGGDEVELRLDEPLPAGTVLKVIIRQRKGRTLRSAFEVPRSVVIVHRTKIRGGKTPAKRS